MSKTLITNKPDSFRVFFKKVWDYRALIKVFAVRDLKVKYAQTSLGIAWSLLQPLTALVIYTFFFEYLLEMESGEFPYTLHVLSGLLGWNFFTYTVTAGSQSIQESSSLIKKIYFPKAILPLSKVFVAGAEMVIGSLLLIPLMLYFGISVQASIIVLPFIWVYNALCALALVFWLGSFATKKRDLYHLVPFLVYFGIWITPVFFSEDLLPAKVAFIADYNPMANVLSLWRWALFGSGSLSTTYLFNFLVVSGICLSGMYFFNRRESSFSDYS
jgi:lipopolysaccharide transport system permease protein